MYMMLLGVCMCQLKEWTMKELTVLSSSGVLLKDGWRDSWNNLVRRREACEAVCVCVCV